VKHFMGRSLLFILIIAAGCGGSSSSPSFSHTTVPTPTAAPMSTPTPIASNSLPELFTIPQRQHPDGERYRLFTRNVKLPNDNGPLG
jgi:hypothetical protein